MAACGMKKGVDDMELVGQGMHDHRETWSNSPNPTQDRMASKPSFFAPSRRQVTGTHGCDVFWRCICVSGKNACEASRDIKLQ